ncbi:hypothetical protein LP7551_04351 [Roseibium album]|nr:hypothetical protein LP7551_04351 [Roseibium album]
MTIGKDLSSLLFTSVAAVLLLTVSVAAQDGVDPDLVDIVTDGQPDRYSLVAVDGDILRVDRQNGTVSVCQEQNSSWRCSPVPLAEDAYLAEINELAEEVDRLTARLEEIESGDTGNEEMQSPETSEVQPEADETPEKDSPKLSNKDEEELEKVLTFTESAMRRFFGMVRDLQKDFDGDNSSN